MSFTIDDLVSSLSTNHIGQEAIDLAALQAQLSQSLFTSTHNVTCTKVGQGNCNTPVARTPSSTFNWSDRNHGGDFGGNRRSRSSSIVGRQRHNSIDERGGYYYTGDIEESEEDEQMVEDLLYPSSPISPGASSASSSSSQFSPYPRTPSGTSAYGSSPPSPAVQSDNHFALTDPFYLEQLQQQHQQTQNLLSSSSFFSQMGRPTPHSPFSQPQAQPQYHYSNHQQFCTCEVDHHVHSPQHSVLLGATAFDR